MNLRSFSFSNQGGRDENQDSALRYEDAAEGIYAVADGLGGHKGGAAASACVVKCLMDAWERSDAKNMSAWLTDRIGEANQAILEMQQQTHSGMKSTVAALIVRDKRAVWAHTGDSRLYHLRDGRIEHVTEDHSVAFKKYKSGEISKAAISSDADQSSLLKALGKPSRWEPDAKECELRSGDAFLLCTDGIWEYVTDEEILADWLKSRDPKSWAELVLLRVISRIPPDCDNLTLVTVMAD